MLNHYNGKPVTQEAYRQGRLTCLKPASLKEDGEYPLRVKHEPATVGRFAVDIVVKLVVLDNPSNGSRWVQLNIYGDTANAFLSDDGALSSTRDGPERGYFIGEGNDPDEHPARDDTAKSDIPNRVPALVG